MKVVCAKDVFDYSVSIAERFTGKNINLPILTFIQIETAANTLVITATNLEHAIQISVPAKIASPGKVSVPAKILTQTTQSIQEETVELEGKNDILTIKTPTREGKIHGTRSEDFPIVPKVKKTTTYTFPSSALVDGIEKVLPAVSSSEFKPELNGVFFHVSSRELVLAATDTFRLAEKKIKNDNSDEETKKFIIPVKIAQEIVRVFAGEEREIAVSIGENQVEISGDGIRIVSRLVDGNFPEYPAIIPKVFSTSLFLKKAEFANAVRASSIFASKLQDVHLVISPKKTEIRAENSEVGFTTISLATEHSGKPLDIQFNYRFLLDGIAGINDEEVFFGATDASAPALLRNKNDASFTYVIMPIKQT